MKVKRPILITVAVLAVMMCVLMLGSYLNAIRVANAYVADAPDGPYEFVTGRFVGLTDPWGWLGFFTPMWVLRYDNPKDDLYTRIYVNLTGTKVYNVRGLSPVPLFGEVPPSRWYGPGGTRTKDTTKP